MSSPLSLSAVILHNDDNLAQIAFDSCQGIGKLVPGACVDRIRAVNLETLEGTDDASPVSMEAREANLVFICLKEDTVLSDWQTSWMGEWAYHRSCPLGALIQLHQGGEDWRGGVLVKFCQTLAKLGQMELVQRKVENGSWHPREDHPIRAVRFVGGENSIPPSSTSNSGGLYGRL